MKKNILNYDELDPVGQAAAAWTVRMSRGLTAEEQDEFSEWLAQDSSHAEAMRESHWAWDELDRLAGLQPCSPSRIDPDLLESGNHLFPWHGLKRWWPYLAAGSSIAALIILGLFYVLPGSRIPDKIPVEPALDLMARIEQQILPDGTKVELNRMSDIEVTYTSVERRVNLLNGEANFDVVKDPDRPFIVNVGGVDVRAVGTVFSVKYSDSHVQVLVSEGKVGVTSTNLIDSKIAEFPEAILSVGQLGRIDFDDDTPMIGITNLSHEQLKELTIWRPVLLDFDDTSLNQIIAEFNRRNPIQIALEDPELYGLILSSSFWSDNVEGFVRLMVSSFGTEAEWRGSQEIVLRKKSNRAI